MQSLSDDLAAAGHPDVTTVSVNQWASLSGLEAYAEETDGPVLQDSEGDPVRHALGGKVYSFWIIDRHGLVRASYGALAVEEHTEDLTAVLIGLLAEP